jgi:hypothetical protein
VGKVEEKVEEINSAISQVRNEINSQRFFELGVDHDVVQRFQSQLETVSLALKELESIYDAKPFGERKAYFDAIRIVRKSVDFLREVRRQEAGNEKNTQTFLDTLNDLDDILPNFLNSRSDVQKNEGSSYDQISTTWRGDTVGERLPAQPNPIEITNQNFPKVNRIKTKSLVLKILMVIAVSIPRVMGRAVLDLFGHGKDSADTTYILLGYILIVISVLVFWGIIDINSLRDFFTGWWRFFHPVK